MDELWALHKAVAERLTVRITAETVSWKSGGVRILGLAKAAVRQEGGIALNVDRRVTGVAREGSGNQKFDAEPEP